MRNQRLGQAWHVLAIMAVMLVSLFVFSTDAYAAKGWTYQNGAYYYYENNGTMRKNAWASYGGSFYYLGSNGRVVTNTWVKYNGSYYYLGSDGRVVTNGWAYYYGADSYAAYYMGSDGRAVTNRWIKDGGTYYYVASNGQRVINSWVKYNGKYYYINYYRPVSNTTIILNGISYYFGDNGACIGSYNNTNQYVSTVYDKTIVAVGEGTCTYRVPQININSAYAKSINNELNSYLAEAKESVARINQGSYYAYSLGAFDYACYLNGDILSLLVYAYYPGNTIDDYVVYNINVKTGERVTNSQVLLQANVGTASYNALLKEKLRNHYEYIYAGSKSVQGYSQKLQETLSSDNLALAVPYINSQGKLCVVANYRALAGATDYRVPLFLQ